MLAPGSAEIHLEIVNQRKNPLPDIGRLTGKYCSRGELAAFITHPRVVRSDDSCCGMENKKIAPHQLLCAPTCGTLSLKLSIKRRGRQTWVWFYHCFNEHSKLENKCMLTWGVSFLGYSGECGTPCICASVSRFEPSAKLVRFLHHSGPLSVTSCQFAST